MVSVLSPIMKKCAAPKAPSRSTGKFMLRTASLQDTNDPASPTITAQPPAASLLRFSFVKPDLSQSMASAMSTAINAISAWGFMR